jgi:enoyl-CoA hydratase
MLDYERRGPVAVVTVDRPERRNAIDEATAERLADAFDRFAADDAAAVAVLTGAGGDFSAGADLAAMDLTDKDGGFLGVTRTRVEKPVVAAVEGYCVAGGLELACWCDLRVAASDATFGCFERRFGVPLVDGGTQRLPRIVGQGRALDIILTGRSVDAAEALDWGLVDRVVAPGEALERAVALGERIASFPQETVRSDLGAVYDGAGRDLEAGLRAEAWRGSRVLDVAREGAERFASGEGRGGAGLGEAPRDGNGTLRNDDEAAPEDDAPRDDDDGS